MILTKSKIYETRIFIPEICDIDLNAEIEFLVNKNYRKIIYFLIIQGKKKIDLNMGMSQAIKNNIKLIDFFISLGASKRKAFTESYFLYDKRLINFFMTREQCIEGIVFAVKKGFAKLSYFLARCAKREMCQRLKMKKIK